MGWFEDAVKTVAPHALLGPTYTAATMAPGIFGQISSGLGIGKSGGGGESNGAGPGDLFGGGAIGGAGSLSGTNAAARNADLEAGYKKGKEIFYDDPDMQDLRNRRLDQSKGYDGKELGAMREQARNEVEGSRSTYLRQLAGKTAKAGVGGARAAAMGASADKGFQANRAELERKMTLDNANMVRQGTDSLQDFLMRQKYGTLGTGLGYGQLGVADRTADAQAAAAAKEPKKGILTSFLDPLIGGMM